MENAKVVVEINGIQYQDEQIKSFLTFFENGVLRISLTIDPETPTEEEPRTAPEKSAEQSGELTQPYILEGTEYPINDEMHNNIKERSNLRGQRETKGIKETKEIQSESYNVKDVTCFDSAIENIIEQENELFVQGYKFFTEITKPTATFTSATSGDFALTEKIVVIKVTKTEKVVTKK